MVIAPLPITVQSPMEVAFAEAESALARSEIPVGAVLVAAQSGKILASASNRMEEWSDPTAHAELLAIRIVTADRAAMRLPDCDLYVTLEPCPMCAAAIAFARIRRLYFGAYNPKGGAVEHGPRLFYRSTCYHRPDVYGGLQERRAATLLRQFFLNRRSADKKRLA